LELDKSPATHQIRQSDPGPVPAISITECDLPSEIRQVSQLQTETHFIESGDFNPYPPVPLDSERLHPLDLFFFRRIDWIGQSNTRGTGAVVHSFGCDPSSADGTSELSDDQILQCVTDLRDARRDGTIGRSLPSERISQLLRFCHIDFKDRTSGGCDKAMARFRDQCLPSIHTVATADTPLALASSVVG
jgi:hypothetical protein